MDTAPIRTLSDVQQASVAKQLHALFDHWELSSTQRWAIMGIAEPSNAEHIDWMPYLTGEGKERATYFLAIHAALRILFPANIELAYRWMQTPNQAFGGATPVALIAESGMAGIVSVHAYLQAVLGQ
jgi:hypothetical protein